MRNFEDLYVAIWCIVMPITGTVLLPGVQGTIPAYMMAFGSMIFVYRRVRSGEIPAPVIRHFWTLLSVILLWLTLMVASQLGLMASGRHDFDDNSVLFRRTMFTQSLYFFACVLIAIYFRNFFKPRWRRYIHWGGYFLAAYGIYEWLFFLVFHESGDFLVNRTFGDEHTASWSQSISFGGFQLLRIKSTLGEPTFFTAAVLPYFFFALDDRKVALSCMLLFAAIFSTSTACFLTLPTVLLIKAFWTGKIRWDYLAILGFFALILGGMALHFPDTFRDMFLDKFSGNNDSGAVRRDNAIALADLYQSFTVPNWIFGIGFGYCYLNLYDAMLVNTGIIGLVAFLWTFGRPALFLPTTPGYEGLKAGLVAVLLLSGISLSEFYLPPTWMFLGVAWYYLADHRRQRNKTQTAVPVPETPARPELAPYPWEEEEVER
jgi:hypothetical protein